MSTGSKIANDKEKPLLLFSCLDWGLGHTTRSVPLIKEFLNSGCDLIVACNSIQKTVLEREFPGITYVDLPGYDIHYSSSRWRTRLEVVFQLRKILTKIKMENNWLTTFLLKNRVSGVVSDNRYGFYHPVVPSILITHQLSVYTSGGRVADKISQKFIYNFIRRFSECWIPDFEKQPFLAGNLSHPTRLPQTVVRYMGALSRFEILKQNEAASYDIAVVLSGPEPQRTIMESLILTQAETLNKKMVLVRGLPGESAILQGTTIEVHNHLSSRALNELVCNSKLIVCRSGYTSVMDMAKLKKKMIVVPTPGQPEQEYLARWLSHEQLAISIEQHKFSLKEAIDLASSFEFRYVEQNTDQYQEVVRSFVAKISS